MQEGSLNEEQFFEENYTGLRDQPPMLWMRRFFKSIIIARTPRLVDLPTGAGKTDVAVIWVIALAWYGLNRGTLNPVPRRLIWVVNRRVLVQQVFRLADALKQKIFSRDSSTNALAEMRRGLGCLSGNEQDVFRVVQLRGQLIDDRKWSVAPAVPQLIVGTVDQVGSRLLFQGYGLGKWSRPMQAALLAVDAWICVDEAHLVPSFVLTLRQVLPLITENKIPPVLARTFARLPFWLTELSATPGLPNPSPDLMFSLNREDEADPRLADRLLAAKTREVKIEWLRTDETVEDRISRAALGASSGATAVFVSTPGTANKIKNKIALQEHYRDRIVCITGRLRGYERDRLEMQQVFRYFCSRNEEGKTSLAFLVGTSAAEVGLDADVDAIYCDFASLITLTQRLGRLDRRGRLSRRASNEECAPPTMTIFARPSEVIPGIERRILDLARKLRIKSDQLDPTLLLGTHWVEATSKRENKQEDAQEDDEAEASKTSRAAKIKKFETKELISASTRSSVVTRRLPQMLGTSTVARQPSCWLRRPLARVTAGPVSVPPLTTAVVEHWAATTTPRSKFLPVHPFLYGILPDEEGTPLVSVAFRLEMDALIVPPNEENGDIDEQPIAEQILSVFRQFAPRRAEFHQVPVNVAKDWLSSKSWPLAFFDGDDWCTSMSSGERPRLQPGNLLILPTRARDDARDLLDDMKDPATNDVLEGVSMQNSPYMRLVVQIRAGDYELNSNGDGALRFCLRAKHEAEEAVLEARTDINAKKWKKNTSQKVRIGTATFRFDYYKPAKNEPGLLLLEEHLMRAIQDAGHLSRVIAPGEAFLETVLVESARVHDIGKRDTKWQRAMGNLDPAHPIAKPIVEKPRPMGGFRHEWQSLLEIKNKTPEISGGSGYVTSDLGLSLLNHLVASHHGHLRPWLWEGILERHETGQKKQRAMRLESAERFVRLQRELGPWRLAYLEALLKASDVAASQILDQEENDEQ